MLYSVNCVFRSNLIALKQIYGHCKIVLTQCHQKKINHDRPWVK